MAVTYIDPAQGALGQAFGQLTEAIANRANAKKLRFKAFQENPQAMQGLASAFRAAGTPEKQQALVDSLGLNLEDVQTTASGFQPTMQEELETGFRKGGGVKKTVEQQLSGLDTSILENTFKTGNLKAGIAMGLPAAQAGSDFQTALAGIQKGKYEGRLYNLMQEGDRIELGLKAKDIADQLGIAQGTAGMKALEETTGYISTLDMSKPENQRYAMQFYNYMTNPQFAASLDRMAEWDLQMEFEKLKQGAPATPEEIWASTAKMDEYYQSLFDKYSKAETDEGKDYYGTAINRMNQVRDQFVQAGRIIDLPNAYILGRGSDNEVRVPLVHEPIADTLLLDVATMIQSGATDAEIDTEVVRQNVLSQLNPNELNQFQIGLDELKKTNPSDRRIERIRRAREKAKGTPPNVGPFVQAPDVTAASAPAGAQVSTELPELIKALGITPRGR